jgi:hypothetical protein
MRRVPARTRRRLILALGVVSATALVAVAVVAVVSALAAGVPGAVRVGPGTVLLRAAAGSGGPVEAYVGLCAGAQASASDVLHARVGGATRASHAGARPGGGA